MALTPAKIIARHEHCIVGRAGSPEVGKTEIMRRLALLRDASFVQAGLRDWQRHSQGIRRIMALTAKIIECPGRFGACSTEPALRTRADSRTTSLRSPARPSSWLASAIYTRNTNIIVEVSHE